MDNKKYLDKITSQHKTKPKFNEWLTKNLALIDNVIGVIEDYDADFDIYKAIGMQQDILGDIIGRKRELDFQPVDGSDPKLNDNIYRMLQLAKISMNQFDGTIPGVIELWKRLFEDYQIIIQDNQDMSMNISIIGPTSMFEKELIYRGYVVPKPEGVRINYEFYMHLYNSKNSNYFAATTFLCSHYKIDSKATVAEDMVVQYKQNYGTVINKTDHFIIN